MAMRLPLDKMKGMNAYAITYDSSNHLKVLVRISGSIWPKVRNQMRGIQMTGLKLEYNRMDILFALCDHPMAKMKDINLNLCFHS